MEFDSNHKVKIKSLTGGQPQAVIDFLQAEKKRHVKCVEEADFMWSMIPIISEIYESAIIRHQEDIVAIDIKIAKIKEMFGL